MLTKCIHISSNTVTSQPSSDHPSFEAYSEFHNIHSTRDKDLSYNSCHNHKNPNDESVINELSVHTYRIHKCILTIKQNDASVCYDRIIANHSSLKSRREVTPKRVFQLRVSTLDSSKHHVHTSIVSQKILHQY